MRLLHKDLQGRGHQVTVFWVSYIRSLSYPPELSIKSPFQHIPRCPATSHLWHHQVRHILHAQETGQRLRFPHRLGRSGACLGEHPLCRCCWGSVLCHCKSHGCFESTNAGEWCRRKDGEWRCSWGCCSQQQEPVQGISGNLPVRRCPRTVAWRRTNCTTRCGYSRCGIASLRLLQAAPHGHVRGSSLKSFYVSMGGGTRNEFMT